MLFPYFIWLIQLGTFATCLLTALRYKFCPGERDQGERQVPAEEGAVPGRGGGQREHGGQGVLLQHPAQRQLPHLAPQEELAEREPPRHLLEAESAPPIGCI